MLQTPEHTVPTFTKFYTLLGPPGFFSLGIGSYSNLQSDANFDSSHLETLYSTDRLHFFRFCPNRSSREAGGVNSLDLQGSTSMKQTRVENQLHLARKSECDGATNEPDCDRSVAHPSLAN